MAGFLAGVLTGAGLLLALGTGIWVVVRRWGSSVPSSACTKRQRNTKEAFDDALEMLGPASEADKLVAMDAFATHMNFPTSKQINIIRTLATLAESNSTKQTLHSLDQYNNPMTDMFLALILYRSYTKDIPQLENVTASALGSMTAPMVYSESSVLSYFQNTNPLIGQAVWRNMVLAAAISLYLTYNDVMANNDLNKSDMLAQFWMEETTDLHGAVR